MTSTKLSQFLAMLTVICWSRVVCRLYKYYPPQYQPRRPYRLPPILRPKPPKPSSWLILASSHALGDSRSPHPLNFTCRDGCTVLASFFRWQDGSLLGKPKQHNRYIMFISFLYC